ncbi:MAG: hypothetical protein IIC01_08630 [Planctomycetes bacterium]|nr:hypothetical protein [Planctomycetota bacterium]
METCPNVMARPDTSDMRLPPQKRTTPLEGRWDRAASSPAPASCAAVLVGWAAGMVVTGLALRLGSAFSQIAPPTEAVIGGAFLALALGVAVPTRLATWVCATAWQRFVSRGKRSEVSAVLLDVGSADRPLYWVVLSVIALGGGIATALLPIHVHFALVGYDWLLAHFVWSEATLDLLHVGIALATGFVPLTMLGLAASCTHHLSCPWGRWETRATGWWLIGGCGGVWTGSWLARSESAGNLVLLAASLPSLLAAVVSVAVSSARPGRWAASESESSPLPMWSDRWPRLLRAGIVAVGGGGACGAFVWAGHLAGEQHSQGAAPGAMLLAMAVGVFAACRSRRSGLRSIGGFGVASACAGVIVAVTTVLLAHAPGAGGGLCHAAAWVAVSGIAYATTYGRKTLLDRVASRSTAGAKVLAGLLACAGFTIWLGAPRVARWMGEPATLVLLALSLLALGGMLIIHEPSYSPATRRVRLWAVFASVGMMILASSSSWNPWRVAPPPGASALGAVSVRETGPLPHGRGSNRSLSNTRQRSLLTPLESWSSIRAYPKKCGTGLQPVCFTG